MLYKYSVKESLNSWGTGLGQKLIVLYRCQFPGFDICTDFDFNIYKEMSLISGDILK